MRGLVDIAWTGVESLVRHRLRSVVTVLTLCAALGPYLIGVGIAAGVRNDAVQSLEVGGDLYVSAERFGRWVALPRVVVDEIEKTPGVVEAVPRIVGRITIGRDPVGAIIVGLPPDQLTARVECVEGRLPRDGRVNEVVIGTKLSRHLKLDVDAMIPPFYRNDREGEHLSKVVGVFSDDAGLWQSHVLLTTLKTAARLFDQQQYVSDCVLRCQSGYEAVVAKAAVRMRHDAFTDSGDSISLRVVQRDVLTERILGTHEHRAGIFNLHYSVIFSATILTMLVTSGLGLTERRREIGLLKAIGWQTDEVLLRTFSESSVLAIAGACSSILLSWGWVRLANGYGIAPIFLPGVDADPDFAVPFLLGPGPAFTALLLAFVIVVTGSVYSSWRAAIAPPQEAMR